MILTQCAVCAAPLGLALGKKCGRCCTRCCGPACQAQHWKEGGHDKLCKKIKRGGGAEQYHANKKYEEAVAVAAETCAEDTKGQTCYICIEVLHRHTKEGLVRGCACHTTEGFVHVSCLAEQAKVLVKEAGENRLGDKVMNERWVRWYSCSLCKQEYHGEVRCALGWAYWKTYMSRPEENSFQRGAMNLLGLSLTESGHHEDALSVGEALLFMMRRLGISGERMLATQSNLAITYGRVGRLDESLMIERNVYSGRVKLDGEEHFNTIQAAANYANSLLSLQRLEEAKSLVGKIMPVVRRDLGDNHALTLRIRCIYAMALSSGNATLGDLREAVRTLEETERIARRVLGGAHPTAVQIESNLKLARELEVFRRRPSAPAKAGDA